eukprot:CAMPEP_0204837406 /NCGR_PEP_ID=MMETSP1346-20131115/27689_1 /ASSEMBLY_ACC=CAM_ASM_000771 /TAXON_ID=215587 /ORGANISM="Aplanochytrium stocchinoi, Strain GSBS06" /LENGTH=85 /DNA_ID=CAMNT_0051972799 /DNA_START=278 /DNA_END=535 /DNA_ORIENTATION=+
MSCMVLSSLSSSISSSLSRDDRFVLPSGNGSFPFLPVLKFIVTEKGTISVDSRPVFGGGAVFGIGAAPVPLLRFTESGNALFGGI